MAINTGIEHLVDKKSPIERQLEQHENAWRSLRNKLDSMLIGTTVIKGDAVRKNCQELDQLDSDNRHCHIAQHWGTQYAERSKPILHQLDALEKEITKLRSLKQ